MAFAKVQARGADLTTHIGPEIRLLLALVTANSPGTLVSIFGVLMLGTALEIAIAGPKLELLLVDPQLAGLFLIIHSKPFARNTINLNAWCTFPRQRVTVESASSVLLDEVLDHVVPQKGKLQDLAVWPLFVLAHSALDWNLLSIWARWQQIEHGFHCSQKGQSCLSAISVLPITLALFTFFSCSFFGSCWLSIFWKDSWHFSMDAVEQVGIQLCLVELVLF